MYNHLRGTLVSCQPTRLVVETGGIGWEVTVSLATSQRAGAPGAEVRLLTHLVVREDLLQLVGFLTEEERHLFRTLIGLSGVGPALALQILSAVTPEAFARVVEQQDTAALKRIKGVGEKTAKRIILELKGAKTLLPPSEEAGEAPTGMAADAVAALVAMGLTQRDAVERVERVTSAEEGLSLEDAIRRALR